MKKKVLGVLGCSGARVLVRGFGVLVLGWFMVLGFTGSVQAHHSFAGEYDGSKPVSVTGAVTKVEWTNPHARFYVDTKEADGSITHWEFELGSPNLLIRYGFSKDLLKIGDTVSVDGYRARDGSNVANAKSVKFSDGRMLSAGSSAALVDTK
jgi:hypothetical protein